IAAHRGGVTTVLVPKENEKDLVELPAQIKKALEIQLVEHMDEVLKAALAAEPADFMRDGVHEIDDIHEVQTVPAVPTISPTDVPHPAGVN
ncbi:MAG: S16 family serine protease, partial [Myxococcota bacterium]